MSHRIEERLQGLAPQTLLVECAERIVTVTVNRPAARNALSRATLTELERVLQELQAPQPDEVRGVLLTGAGDRAFVAGADIREMSAMTPAEGETFGRLGQGVTELLESLPVPVVACVNGYALGGGCELAMAADLIYAVDGASLGQPEVTLGLIAGFGGCVRLQRLVGPARARELLYTGRLIDAAEALRLGLVQSVFPSVDEMLTAARDLLARMARNSPVAIALSKYALNASIGQDTAAALTIERSAFRRSFESEDMRVGTRAFLDKAAASFPGR